MQPSTSKYTVKQVTLNVSINKENMFKANDIIKDGDYYRRVHGMLGEVVLASYQRGAESFARKENSVSAIYTSDHANWTIVERDGKPFVPTPWKPELGEVYYYPSPASSDLHVAVRWDSDSIDNFRLERGLVFRTAEEAIRHAKKMLEVK